MSNIQTISQLQRNAAYSEAIELAKIHHLEKLIMKLSSQINGRILFEIQINKLKETEVNLSSFVELSGQVLLHDDKL